MRETPAAILCIDDEEPALALRRLVLENSGYRVFTALTGKQGIELFRHQPIDVVILDYWMADMDGLDVAEQLKALSPKTPIIMLSGYTSILDEGLGRVDLWLRKGEGDPEQLLAAVVQALNSRQQQ
jgi:two-component system, OmpR family, response regulator CpxR